MNKVGFIGTGWVGSTYKKNFESRGYETLAYSLEPEYVGNKDKIKECDIVIIAVPTPTVDGIADYSILKSVVPLVGDAKIAVIKSTVLPGTTDEIQKENPNIVVIHMPEFLSERSAEYDAMNPSRNIIGFTHLFPNMTGWLSEEFTAQKVNEVLDVFPDAPYTSICTASEAELIKYAHNCFGVVTILWHNLLYNICEKQGQDWNIIKDAIKNDKDNVVSYLNPVNKGGRGAGGNCFIKDFSAFSEYYKTIEGGNGAGRAVLMMLENLNIKLLLDSKKDLDILKSVYKNQLA